MWPSRAKELIKEKREGQRTTNLAGDPPVFPRGAEMLRIEDEAIFAARRVGTLAYNEAVRTGEPAECP